MTFTNLDTGDSACTGNAAAFLNTNRGTHEYSTNVVFFKVKNDGLGTVVKRYEFTGLRILEAVYTGNTVTNLEYGCRTLQDSVALVYASELLLDDTTDFVGLDSSHGCYALKDA